MLSVEQRRSRILSPIGLLVVMAVSAGFSSRLNAESTGEATTSREAREEAIRSIPFDQLTDEMQARLWSVVRRPSIYRHLPAQTFACDPDMHVFLIRNPEIVLDIWRLMGVTKATVTRNGPYSILASDGMGTSTEVELVYGTKDTHVFYGEGYYEGPLLKRKIHGRCVLLLRTEFVAGDGRPNQVVDHLDIFLQVDHLAADLIARTLHPLVGKSADHNFAESMTFVGRLSEKSEQNGAGVQRLAARLTNVDVDVRRQFAELANIVHHRALLRDGSNPPRTSAAAGE